MARSPNLPDAEKGQGDRLPPPGAQGSAVRSALGRQKASEKDADKGWREK